MQFYKYPDAYAPVGAGIPAIFGLQLDAPDNIDLRIRKTESNRLLGGKRFVNVSRADIDVAARIRSVMAFTPSTGKTGFKSTDGRLIRACVEALHPGSETIELTSETRTFIPGDQSAQSSGLRTAMPLNRLIPAGEADEISLFNNNCCTVLVSGSGRDSTVAEQFESSQYGWQVFRLNTADFPDCDTITVDTGIGESIVYTVIPASQNAVRLAWESHTGAIEHYSFPTVRQTSLLVEKLRTESPEGYLVTAAETLRKTTIVSAFELPEVLEPLAELTSARNVWALKRDIYTPIDILTDEVVIQQHGTLCALELAFRPKTASSWN